MSTNKEAVSNVVNALSRDGQEWILNSGRVIVFTPSVKLARKMINQGWFDDWVQDEESYLNLDKDGSIK